MAPTPLIESNPANFSVGREGKKIIRIYFHRTAVKGDSATGEANYFHSHVLKASAGAFIDLDGSVVQSVRDSNTEWAVDQFDENEISYSIEFCGLNGTPLNEKQILTAISFIKGDPLLKAVPLHRLTLAEIPPRKVAGYGCHADVTHSYKEPQMSHVDAISEAEIQAIFKGLAA